MDVLTTVIIAVGALVIVGAAIMWWISSQAWRFKFILLNKDGMGYKELKAKRVKDKRNKNLKVFMFKNNDTTMPIKEPNGWINNKPVRVIAFGPSGQYVYVDKSKIDKSNFLEYSLEPEERELALWQFNENQRRYSQVDKSQIAALVGNVIMVLIITIGIIYAVIAFTNNADKFAELAKENSVTTSTLRDVGLSLEKTSENLLLVAKTCNGQNTTFIRQLE